MLRFLMIDKNLEVVKGAFAVIAPRAFQDLIDAGSLALVLVAHLQDEAMCGAMTGPCEFEWSMDEEGSRQRDE